MSPHAPVAIRLAYVFTEEEARESVNSAYNDPRPWDCGCRSWHNGGVGDASVGLTFVARPLGRYALVPCGEDEGYPRESVCCSLRGGFDKTADCPGGLDEKAKWPPDYEVLTISSSPRGESGGDIGADYREMLWSAGLFILTFLGTVFLFGSLS
jgi:hypothetical protein